MSKQSRARIVIVIGILLVVLSAVISLTRAPMPSSAPKADTPVQQPARP